MGKSFTLRVRETLRSISQDLNGEDECDTYNKEIIF